MASITAIGEDVVKQPGDRSEYHPRRVDLKGMASSATAGSTAFAQSGGQGLQHLRAALF